MRKRIFVYAYLNYNLGDDLFVQSLCERYPNILFCIYTGDPNYPQIFKNIKNIKIYSKNSWQIKLIKSILRKMKNRNKDRDYVRHLLSRLCSACIIIGGSLFMQPVEDWKKHCDTSEFRVIKNKPIFIIGANFGPFDDVEFLEEYKRVFSKYTDVCFRDQYSYKLFQDMGNIRVAPDVLFNLIHERTEERTNQVAISVINLENRATLCTYADIYRRKIVEIIRYYIIKSKPVKLFSFCMPEGDEEEINRVLQEFNEDELQLIGTCFYTDNMEQVINELHKSDYVIATRFHAMILGWVLEVPVFPISYSDKMLNVINDINFDGNYADIKDMNKLTIEQVDYNYKNRIRLDLSRIQERAKLQFSGFDSYYRIK